MFFGATSFAAILERVMGSAASLVPRYDRAQSGRREFPFGPLTDVPAQGPRVEMPYSGLDFAA